MTGKGRGGICTHDTVPECLLHAHSLLFPQAGGILTHPPIPDAWWHMLDQWFSCSLVSWKINVLFMVMVDRGMALHQRCPYSNPQKLYVTLHGKKKALLMWLRIIRRGDYPGLFVWVQRNHKDHFKRLGKRTTGEVQAVTAEARGCWSYVRKGPWAKKCRWALHAGKGKKMDSPHRASRENQSCWCLGFCPVRLDFGILIFRAKRCWLYGFESLVFGNLGQWP